LIHDVNTVLVHEACGCTKRAASLWGSTFKPSHEAAEHQALYPAHDVGARPAACDEVAVLEDEFAADTADERLYT
jgi:hypothetical protein